MEDEEDEDDVVEDEVVDDDDDSDEEVDWQKLEEDLERNAARANLTTVNVKSILHVSTVCIFVSYPFTPLLLILAP